MSASIRPLDDVGKLFYICLSCYESPSYFIYRYHQYVLLVLVYQVIAVLEGQLSQYRSSMSTYNNWYTDHRSGSEAFQRDPKPTPFNSPRMKEQ